MTKQFLLFRDGRRLRAAHRQLPRVDTPLLVNGRRFTPAGSFIHLSHITNNQKRLLGFSVDALEQANTAPDWRAWWESFDNRHIWDFWQAYIFLVESMPSDWHDDGALLVGGGDVLTDRAGDYLLALPDYNGYCFSPNEPTEFWKEIGFELAQLDLAVTE
jgi:hypothetical protein